MKKNKKCKTIIADLRSTHGPKNFMILATFDYYKKTWKEINKQ